MSVVYGEEFQERFKKLDKNSDGQLDRSELPKLNNNDADLIMRQIAAFQGNRDGRLTHDELFNSVELLDGKVSDKEQVVLQSLSIQKIIFESKKQLQPI